MTPMTPIDILNRMLSNDLFSQWLGVECLSVSEGACTLRATVRPEMTNGFGVAHGGITFSLADSAFAFASNSRGQHAVSIETSIAHTVPVFPGDVLTATATEDHRSQRLGRYTVRVLNQNNKTVALFHGTVFIKPDAWALDPAQDNQ